MTLKVNSYSFRENIVFEIFMLKALTPLYVNTFRYIEQQSDPCRRIYLRSIATRNWRVINNALSKFLNRPLHCYCGCDLSNGKIPCADREISSSLKGKTAILYSWSCGGGHNVVQAAIADRLAQVGMHVYSVNASQDVLNRFDIALKLTWGRCSTEDVYNWLMRNQYWRTIKLLSWFFSGEKPAVREKKIASFQFSILKRGKSDVVVTCFDRSLSAIEKACARLGIPVASFAADFDPSLCLDISCPADIENRRFVRSIMFPNQDELLRELQDVLSPQQIQFGGLPVRSSFLKRYDPTALRQKWEVQDGKRVVILMSGGVGTENSFADFITKQYKNRELPIHLFIICGKNEAQKKQLEKALYHQINPYVSTTVLGWIDETAVAELEAMAADDQQKGVLISTKGGGGTLSEGVAMGVRLLVQDISPIPWEKTNIDFVCRNGFGVRFTKKEELLERLTTLLETPCALPAINYREVDSFARSIQLIEDLVSTQ